jgi:hypothetical protein
MKFLSDPTLSNDLYSTNSNILVEREKLSAWELIKNSNGDLIVFANKKEFLDELPFLLHEVLNYMMMEFDCYPSDSSSRARAAKLLASILSIWPF